MGDCVISALIGFGRTLEDSSVQPETKLQVLKTLNEVSLTLNELSESGVGRSVGKLKKHPGELGNTARQLVAKWKRLLHDHLVKQSLQDPSPSVNGEHYSRASEVQPGTPIHVDNAEVIGKSCSVAPNEKCSPESNSRKKRVLPSEAAFTNGDTQVPTKRKSNSKRILESLDSSSGLSFMESLNVECATRSRKKKTKSQSHSSHHVTTVEPQAYNELKSVSGFSDQVLSALCEDFDRPDIIYKSVKEPAPKPTLDLDDGDLKFKSKKILWVPKSSRTLNTNSTLADVDHPKEPASLIDLCLAVLERNLSRLDHVGDVPYELLAPVFKHATAEDLARIEHCNPQFTGCTDELWQRHIQRNFTTHRPADLVPQSGETWLELYERLSREEHARLNRIIDRSARRIREEQESRRTTLTTEAIAPRQVQRRLARHSLVPVKKASSSTEPVFKPYNVSQPSVNSAGRSSIEHADKREPLASKPTNGGLLNKLRKQFRSRHMR